MNLRIELTDDDMKLMVYNFIQNKLGEIELDKSKIRIEVITTQNYNAKEWEKGRFRAIYET